LPRRIQTFLGHLKNRFIRADRPSLLWKTSYLLPLYSKINISYFLKLNVTRNFFAGTALLRAENRSSSADLDIGSGKNYRWLKALLLFLISAALAHLCSESGLNFGVSSFSHDVFFLLLMALPAIVSTPTKFDENKFSGMDVSIPFPVIVVDQNGNILRANPAALSFFGLPDDRLLRRNLFDFCGGNVPEKTQLREALEKVCKGLPAANSIAKLVRDDGHPLRTLVFMAPVQFAENRTKSVQLFLMDASGVMEPELNRSLSLLEAVLESTAEGILVVDTEGNIQRYNRRFIDLWEIPEGVLEAQRDDAALKFVLNQLAEPRKFFSK